MSNSSMQTTKFNIQLGNSVEFKEGFFEIYAIGENPIVETSTIPISSTTFSVDLDNSSDIYYAIILTITKSNLGSYAKENPIQLLSIFNGASAAVVLNEPLTIANTFCYAQFMQVAEDQSVHIGGNARSIKVAHLMRLNFMDDAGNLSPVISSSPNALETNSYSMWNSLSNLLYYCLNDNTTYQSFLEQTSTPDKSATSFLQALSALVHDPFNKVEAIYELVCAEEQPYTPSLPQITLPKGNTTAVSQWTLTIKVSDSGAQNFLIGGPAFVVFDKNDRAWITNNVTQGTPNSSAFCTVLEPDGSPAAFSPLFGGGLLGAGFGVTTDKAKEKIYVGNYGWGPSQCNPQTGSLSVFSSEGQMLSPPNGFTNGLHRVQGLKFDGKGNLWMCSWGTQNPLAPSDENYYSFKSYPSSVVVYLQGDPNRMVSYDFTGFESPYNLTFDLVFDKEDNAIVSNGGNYSKDNEDECQVSSIYKLQLKEGKITALASWKDVDNKDTNGYDSFRQVAINSKGEIYLVAMGSNRVIKFNENLEKIAVFTKDMQRPWGITIDANDTLWACSFGKESEDSNGKPQLGPTGIVRIKEGSNGNYSSQFMMLPSGGDEVLLNNGLPLYGNLSGDPTKLNMLPCYKPLMRMTSTNIDRCGNLWAINNWKPAAYIDLKENPGGDGVVIFIGVAPPMF